jgi:hypothetical protein
VPPGFYYPAYREATGFLGTGVVVAGPLTPQTKRVCDRLHVL